MMPAQSSCMTLAVSVPSASATAYSLDTPGGELRGIEQLLEFLAREIGHLGRHFADRSSLRVGLLGDRCTLLVTNHRIECGHQDGIAIECFGNARRMHPEAGYGAVGQSARHVRQQAD